MIVIIDQTNTTRYTLLRHDCCNELADIELIVFIQT